MRKAILYGTPLGFAFYVIGWWRGWSSAIDEYEDARQEARIHVARLHEVKRNGGPR